MKKYISYRYLFPILAFIGAIFSLFTIVSMMPEQSSLPPFVEPFSANSKLSESDSIFGNGIVEPASENIKIGTHLSGIVEKVFVKTGDKVKKNDNLFQLDTEKSLAMLAVRKAAVMVAQSESNMAQSRFALYQNIQDKAAIAREEWMVRQNEYRTKQAQLKEARALYQESVTQLHLCTVTAPFEGEILQVSIHPGEFAQAGAVSEPLIMMGDTRHLNIRVDIDEYSISKLHQNPKALISPKGDTRVRLQGHFMKVEPYLKPKRNLSGMGKELVDTRVLQLIFQLDKRDTTLFVGQQVDVMIVNQVKNPLLKP